MLIFVLLSFLASNSNQNRLHVMLYTLGEYGGGGGAAAKKACNSWATKSLLLYAGDTLQTNVVWGWPLHQIRPDGRVFLNGAFISYVQSQGGGGLTI